MKFASLLSYSRAGLSFALEMTGALTVIYISFGIDGFASIPGWAAFFFVLGLGIAAVADNVDRLKSSVDRR
ncbi:hypothetical protein [Rhizobium sp. CC-YZS058]|uniref:hypothetical protein n=1 Tax=Rhizobium sp. CC-YZS058 TaxID=3042153 RepID=UPI002B060DF3|nr:hypothetical protein [Rhizobium sp. CC-YZS058]MEA3533320.1 hypothetical protein [Rhizobium sp. CC-YZS058]